MKAKLFDNGPEFSRIVAGCMLWGEWGANKNADEVLQLIHSCLELGVTTFDHADIYGHYTTEKLFGNAIKKKPTVRENIQLVTKCGIQLTTPNRPDNTIKHYQTTKKYIIASTEQSLKNLQTDYVDLFLIHRPSPLMHPEEIAEAFMQLKKEGKALHFGVSNFTPWQFEMLHSFFPIITNQVEVSALHLDPFLDGSLDQCLQHQIKPMAYSVLAGGAFFSPNADTKTRRIHQVATQLATKYHVSIDQILIAWILKHPTGMLPIIGSTKVDRIKSAIKALKIEINDQDWFQIWQASTGKEVD